MYCGSQASSTVPVAPCLFLAIIISATFIPTLILEFPFVYFGITKKISFYIVLNVITNMTFNMILFIICYFVLDQGLLCQYTHGM